MWIQQNQSIVFYEVYKHSIHAEKKAIMSVKDKTMLANSKLIVIKITNNKVSFTTPCDMCQRLLNKYKIPKICSMYNEKIVDCCEKHG